MPRSTTTPLLRRRPQLHMLPHPWQVRVLDLERLAIKSYSYHSAKVRGLAAVSGDVVLSGEGAVLAELQACTGRAAE